jgi:preprotein translocase subunit YajC
VSPSIAIAAPILAQEASGGGGNILAFLFPFLILGGLFYVFILMPQRRRQKKTKEMQSSMGIGDEVRTIGGILGTIVGDEDDIFVLDLGGSQMRVVKRAVAERITKDDIVKGDSE